ncbi:RDD family protein [Streptomyces sp. P9(2023)]|uniref:RDD family protein n=1 Tax=Streptomyces sp. P9(2023) TaxID=3064394 RepID=UPI0028F41898|nr:RDD family protein [Streptomyces sp. P9(2023)]MDT9689291.1 RDD family protein [Streptomyces sp. P9(2023)]
MATPPGAGGEVPQAGYYPDPSIPGYIRYWNGGAWVPGTSRPVPKDGELPPAAPAGAMPAGPAPAPNPSPAPVVPAVEETGPVFFDEEPSEPEPSSAWQADVSRQTGFGGDRDQKVSWGGAPEPAAGPVPGARDPRVSADPGPQARLGGLPVTPADPTGGALPGVRRPQPPAAEGTMTIRAQGTGSAEPSVAPAQGPQGAAGAQGVSAAHGPQALTAPHGGQGTPGSQAAPAAQGPQALPAPHGAQAAQGPQALAAAPGAQSAPGSHGAQAPVAPQAAGLPLSHVPGQTPAPTPVAPTPVAPTPVAPTPLTAGPGGGAASWPQQVQQLAQSSAGVGAAGDGEQPVVPWKPPVEDVFLQAARAQAAARPAGLGKRLVARLVDTFVLGALVGGAAFPFVTAALDHIDAKITAAKQSGVTVQVWLLDGTTSLNFGIALAAFLVLGVLYEAVPTAKWGRTLGKKLCGLQVRDIEAHEPPTFRAALRRWLVYSVLGLLVLGVLNVLWCLFDRPWRQCWHDKAAHTFVAG